MTSSLGDSVKLRNARLSLLSRSVKTPLSKKTEQILTVNLCAHKQKISDNLTASTNDNVRVPKGMKINEMFQRRIRTPFLP